MMNVWQCAQVLILRHLTRASARLWSGVERERRADAPWAQRAVKNRPWDAGLNSWGCAATGCQRATVEYETAPAGSGAKPSTAARSRQVQPSLDFRKSARYFGRDAGYLKRM